MRSRWRTARASPADGRQRDSAEGFGAVATNVPVLAVGYEVPELWLTSSLRQLPCLSSGDGSEPRHPARAVAVASQGVRRYHDLDAAPRGGSAPSPVSRSMRASGAALVCGARIACGPDLGQRIDGVERLTRLDAREEGAELGHPVGGWLQSDSSALAGTHSAHLGHARVSGEHPTRQPGAGLRCCA